MRQGQLENALNPWPWCTNLIFAGVLTTPLTTQKMELSIKDFSSKCDQIRRKLQIWSHLLKKSLVENFIFCAVSDQDGLSDIRILQKYLLFSVNSLGVPKIFKRFRCTAANTKINLQWKHLQNSQKVTFSLLPFEG